MDGRGGRLRFLGGCVAMIDLSFRGSSWTLRIIRPDCISIFARLASTVGRRALDGRDLRVDVLVTSS